MLISRRLFVRLITYALAAILVMGVFLIKTDLSEKSSAYLSRRVYENALGELADCMDDLSSSLGKAALATSPGLLSSACTEAYAEACTARQTLGQLPQSDITMKSTASFITKAGDYAAFLSRWAASGMEYTDEHRENIRSLSRTAKDLAGKLSWIDAQIISGELDISQLERLGEELSRSQPAGTMARDFKAMEAEFPELPTLIYDGPFSEHLERQVPRLLEGMEEISADDALEKASEFTGISRSAFELRSLREGNIPVYVVTSATKRGSMTLEITRAGGFVQYFGTNRTVTESRLSHSEAVSLASDFLRSRGMDSMAETYYEVRDNVATVNFAYKDGDVICYPDLVKVSVALDTGEALGFEAQGYIMCHRERSFPPPAVTDEEAEKQVAPGLRIISRALAVIPTAGKGEVFCREFKCEDRDGTHCIVYVNAGTGAQEKILLLLESENGTLAV
ncbi:MAG: germination protein YpeB [Oscillospiraceae bacterium]|nr:germination protein YpeB [Oscillospiraceae bacterium]